VVATGWSGNLDFMSDADSALVPFTLVPVVDASLVYRSGVWAEPDIAAAARILRELAESPPRYAQLAAAAHRRASAASPRFPFPLPSPSVQRAAS